MKQLPENVTALLSHQNIWYLGTYSDIPNAVPVFFKEVLPDGRLLVGDVFMKVTLDNILKNGQVCVSACDTGTMEGYQVKGTAVHLTSGELMDRCKTAVQAAFGGKLQAKGAVVITPEQVTVTTPGPDNNKPL